MPDRGRLPPAREAGTLILAALSCLPLLAAARAAPAGDCGAEGAPAQVAAVLDDLELALDDGRTLRLAGIDPARATPQHPDLGEEARRALAGQLLGRGVVVKPLAPAPDRWDRLPALVFAADDARSATDQPSINETLLDAGWARARPEPAVHGCFGSFLAHEAKARAAGLGLWSDPYYAIVQADDRKSLAERTGAMVLVEGRLHLREGRARIFVALGESRSGVVAPLARRTVKALAKAGLDLQKLAGTLVRMRGFLDDRFGFRLDVVDGAQIEVLAADASRDAAQGPQPGDTAPAAAMERPE